MDAGRYPEFAHLSWAYFHQDWMLDDDIPDAVVRRFMQDEPPGAVERLDAELRSVPRDCSTESDVEQALGPFLGYDPRTDGLTLRGWIEHLIGQLGVSPQ